MREYAQLISRLWKHITKYRKLQFLLLLFLTLISAFAEVVSLGSVLPFLGALSAPETIYNHEYAVTFIRLLDIKTPQELVLPLAILFSIAALIAGAIRLLLSWVSIYVSNSCGADLSIKVYETTLYQPYHIHLTRNSSEVIAGIQKISSAQTTVNACLSIISSGVLIIFIMSALIIINRNVALTAAAFFFLFYMLIVTKMRNQLESNSEIIASHATRMIKALQEGLGGIREVLLDNSQHFYSSIFRKAQIPAMWSSSKNTFITNAPRNIMEALSLCLIAGLAYSLSGDEASMNSALPTLAALALGAQRMLPAIQMLYSGWAGIVGNASQLKDALMLLDQPQPELLNDDDSPSISFKNEICFNNVDFNYSENSAPVIKDLNASIPKSSKVAFVGTTGSGKSTTLNLLMGLLSPENGNITIDNEVLDLSIVRAWQRLIAHVPQNIYLSDSTIAENIAFGIKKEDINRDDVRQAAKYAQIDDFIQQTEDSYDTVIGEFGIRLSGGQRQRIGIARALYKPSEILILDEATSSLDNATEAAVVKSLESLDNGLTIIIVAHRISTVMECDIIFELKDGMICNQGTYKELLGKSESFRDMVKILEEADSERLSKDD